MEAYNREEWSDVTQYMEEALQQYWQESERCRALCEGPYEHDGRPDLYSAIAGKPKGHYRQGSVIGPQAQRSRFVQRKTQASGEIIRINSTSIQS